ncbi:MAG: HEAT repeat domain-containing protein [Isosphaeraceae bacterium]
MGKSRRRGCLVVLLAVAVPAVARAQDRKEPAPASGPVAEEIQQAIVALRNTDIGNPKGWATAARRLTQIGKPAVPALIEELDRTTADRPLRSLGFTLRAIGDPRAVPALIRAIPRTLMAPGSDYGLRMDDPELLAFLRKHDLDDVDRGRQFSFGRAYREVTGALHSITGQRFNEDELNFIHLSGTPKQRWIQRWLYHGLATRWAVWWKKNGKKFTDDPAYSKISLPPLPDAPHVAATSAEQPFPTGPKVKDADGFANVIIGPPQAQEYYRTFHDLDTGRQTKWPGELGDPAKASGEKIAAFAAKEGLDLRGIEYRTPGSERSYYALQALGLRAWQVDNSLYERIGNDLRAEKVPDLDHPAGDLLIDFDPATRTYHPENKATFLFVTREGTTGILQLTGLATEPIRPEDFGRPLVPDPPDPPGRTAPLKPTRGFFRGVQIQYKYLVNGEEER